MAETDPKTALFAFLGYPSFNYPTHSLHETVLPHNNGTDEMPRLCSLLLAWRVCDQTFGRYRPVKGAEKWSRDHHEIENLHIEKFTDSKNVLLFSIYDEK